MPIINPINLENSLFDVAIFGADIFIPSTTDTNNGIYYTPIFKKNSYELWDKIRWYDNTKNLQVPLNVLPNYQIEVRTRTGNALPTKDYATNTKYTLEEINYIIKTNTREYVDNLLLRGCLGRSVTSSYPVYQHANSSIPVSDPFSIVNELGTELNTLRLWNGTDALWTYWSRPIIHTPSYIPPNKNFDYIQARITLKSTDTISIPSMYRINFTSIIKDNC